MRFTYAEAMTDPAHYLPLAQAAEDAGFHGFLVPDSICYPAESHAAYPYTPDGDRGFLEDKAFLEPFSVIPAMAAVTQRIRFVIAISMDAYSQEGIRRLDEQGITDAIVGFRWAYQRGPDTEPLQDKIDNLNRYADTVIGPSR